MSGFNGSRRGPNVSQYIANLNAIPSSHDVVNQHDGAFNLEEDLAVFTNAEFYDFDMGEEIDQQPMPYDPSQEERARRENAAPHKSAGKALDYSQNHGMSGYQVLPFCRRGWDTRSGWGDAPVADDFGSSGKMTEISPAMLNYFFWWQANSSHTFHPTYPHRPRSPARWIRTSPTSPRLTAPRTTRIRPP